MMSLQIVHLCFLALLLVSNTFACSETFECPSTLAGHTCARIKVPLDHSKPNNSLFIPVLYVVATPHPSVAPPPFRHALFYVPGGPGGGSMNDDPQLFATSQVANLIKRPVVAFDPRGTGNASLIDCSLQRLATFSDYSLNAVRNCMKEIGEHQALHYSATAIAGDIELIRKDLDYEQLDVFGLSYGGLIAQVYVAMFPTSTRSLILDSPKPLDLSDIYETRNAKSMLRVHALYAQDESLDFSADKIKAYLSILLHRLRWKQYRNRHAQGLTPRKLFRLYERPMPGFVSAIKKAVDMNDFAPILELPHADRVLTPRPPFDVSLHSRSMAIATRCNSDVPYLPWNANNTNSRMRYRLWKKDLWKKTRISYKPFRPMEAFPRYSRICTAFPFAHLATEALPRSGGLTSDLPALVLYGDRDAGTPLEDIPVLQPVLQRQVAIVKRATHGVVGNPCGLQLVVEFALTQRNMNRSACE